ncbi:hypothetical protein NQZ79_g1897 [Umbelopsis isabellina]|nr:hypothetical protein NQZ79_g1897 [Umbelopsis isabellina]
MLVSRSNLKHRRLPHRLNRAGSSGGGETLLVHLKVFEDVKQASKAQPSDGRQATNIMGKARFLCLTQKKNKIRLYKVKRNATGFSIGKVWNIEEVKSVQNIDTNQFCMTLNKAYTWAVERPKEKMTFLAYVVDTSHRYSGRMPRLINVDEARLQRYMPSIAGTNSGPSPTPSGSNSASYSDSGMVYSPQSREGARSPSSPRYSGQDQFSTSPAPGTIPILPRGTPQHSGSDSMQSFNDPNARIRDKNYNDRHDGIDDRERWKRDLERERDSYRSPPEPKHNGVKHNGPEPNRPPPDSRRPAPETRPPVARYPVPEDDKVIRRNPTPVPPAIAAPQAVPLRSGPPSPLRAKDRERQERHDRAREREELREKSRKDKEIRDEKGKIAKQYMHAVIKMVPYTVITEKQKRLAEMRERMVEQTSLMNVEEMLTDFNWKESGNAAALEKRLLGELQALEAANVHAIIESDERVSTVVGHIDKALEELESMENWLLLYAAELNSMGDDIHQIEWQNRGLQVQTANQRSLVTELQELLASVRVSDGVLQTLRNTPMDNVQDIERVQDAAADLQRVLKVKLGDGLQSMKAVQERVEEYNMYSNTFTTRVHEHLRQSIDSQTGILYETRSRAAPMTTRKNNYVIIPAYSSIEDSLFKYQGLALWMKEMDPRRYNELQMMYAQGLTRTCKRDIKEVMDSTRSYFANVRNRSMDELDFLFRADDSRPVRALGYSSGVRSEESRANRYRNMLRGSVEGVIGSSSSNRDSIDEDERMASDAFTHMMGQVVSLVVREQNFLRDLFQLSHDAPKTFQERGPVLSVAPEKDTLYLRRDKIKDVKISKRVLDLLDAIFDGLQAELLGFVEYGNKADPTQGLSMLVAMDTQCESCEGSDQEFAITMLDFLRDRLEKMFENFIVQQLRAIEETKITSKKRSGILPFIRVFPVLRLEAAGAGAEPNSKVRALINSAYERVVNGMVSSLDAIARESDAGGDDKEQLNAHIMTIENMHHFYHELRAHKIAVLDRWVKHAKNQYETSLNSYIKVVIRRPLGRLLEFFEGVETMMKTSTAEEVSFHMNYNKAQLRKVIAQYPAKEIKKSLEQLYKRVDKHFSEEEGLLQVVWRGIQEEFIRQHEKMEDLIRQCYPDANVSLEFTIQDLLAMMSELARKVNV